MDKFGIYIAIWTGMEIISKQMAKRLQLSGMAENVINNRGIILHTRWLLNQKVKISQK